MGGRGASAFGGKTMGLTVTHADGTQSIFRQFGSKVYSVSGGSLAGSGYKEVPRTLAQIEKNAKKQGVSVTKHSQSQLAEMDKAYAKQREKSEEQLDRLWVRGAGTPRHGIRGH